MEALPAVPVVEQALPLEYRYQTKFAGSLTAGGLLLVWVLLIGAGALSPVVIFLGLLLVFFGLIGFLADPDGVVRSPGRRLVITDYCLQEIDERARVRWVLTPREIKEVRKRSGRRVLPFVNRVDWQVEIWDIVLLDGKRVRVWVWLLPENGRRFKQRFETFLNFSRQRQKEMEQRCN